MISDNQFSMDFTYDWTTKAMPLPKTTQFVDNPIAPTEEEPEEENESDGIIEQVNLEEEITEVKYDPESDKDQHNKGVDHAISFELPKKPSTPEAKNKSYNFAVTNTLAANIQLSSNQLDKSSYNSNDTEENIYPVVSD